MTNKNFNVSSKSVLFFFICILLVNTILHLPFFQLDLIGHHVWRQTQTQTVTDNFYEESMHILNPRINYRGNGEGIYRTDFPLLQWCIAGSYFIFGQSILVSRIFVFCISIFSSLFFYLILKELFGKTIYALAGTWAFTFSPMLFYYSINPLPDNLALLFLNAFLFFFLRYDKTQRKYLLYFSTFLLCISAAIKLQFILFITIPITSLFIDKSNFSMRGIRIILPELFFILITFLPAILWYSWVIPQMDSSGNPILNGLFDETKEKSKYFQYLSYYIFEIVPGILLNYIVTPLFILGIYFFIRNKKWKRKKVIPFICSGFILCLFILYEANVLQLAHDYYFIPFLPLLFILVAYGIQQFILRNKKWIYIFVGLTLLLLPIGAYSRMHGRWNEEKPGFNKNIYLHKEELQNAVPDDALVITGNDDSRFIWLYYLHKKGFNFKKDNLTPEKLHEMIIQGAEYLYTDSKIFSDASFYPYLDSMLIQKGNVAVYQLKKDTLLY